MTRKPASPDHSVRGVVHGYWIQKRELRAKRKAASPKQQAASSKPAELFPVDMYRK